MVRETTLVDRSESLDPGLPGVPGVSSCAKIVRMNFDRQRVLVIITLDGNDYIIPRIGKTRS